ncbi:MULTISPECIES: DUF4280 domain-containing protein [Paenibacillus]|uniref:DUF4280 domain-containing protein n=1 Tax=Paenibacillus woosongensis TaxID=307580 RepID=A0ABQ4MUG3_9BACL|nr:DUF4280 domain-containing protein [Paenibacillus woosongensis]GIP59573.1 hypothetical protein J15TS10_33870 [Paenibacillus woosongensis]
MIIPMLLRSLVLNLAEEDYSYVVRGAVLKCSQGSQPGVLNLPTCHGVYIKDQPLLNVADAVCGANISKIGAFGMCKLTWDICRPEIAPGMEWTDGKKDVLIDGEPALLSKSKLVCSCKDPGGIITIENDGQDL